MKTDNIRYGKYLHFKTGHLYEVIGVALHSETLEEMVVYKALYTSEIYGHERVWVRPKAMFFEQVEHQGQSVARFKWLSE